MNRTNGYRMIRAQKKDFFVGALLLEWDPDNLGWILQEVVEKHYNTISLKVKWDYRRRPLRTTDVTVTASVKEEWYVMKAECFDYSKAMDKMYTGHFEELPQEEWHNILLTQFRRNPSPPVS